MFPPAEYMSADQWLRQLFSSKAACDRGVVRRKVRDVERVVGCLRFEAEVQRRGFRAVQNGQQYVVFCNRESLRLIEQVAILLQENGQDYCNSLGVPCGRWLR